MSLRQRLSRTTADIFDLVGLAGTAAAVVLLLRVLG